MQNYTAVRESLASVSSITIEIPWWALAVCSLAFGLSLQLQKRYRLRIQKSKRRLSWADETNNCSSYDAIGKISLSDFRKLSLDKDSLRNCFLLNRKPVIHVVNRLAALLGHQGFFLVGDLPTAKRVHLVAKTGRRLRVRSSWHTNRSEVWLSFKRILDDDWIPFRVVPIARRGMSLNMLEETKVLGCMFIFQVKFGLPITYSAARCLVPMIDDYCDQVKPSSFGENHIKIATASFKETMSFCKAIRAKHLNDGPNMNFYESNAPLIKVKPQQMAVYLVQAVPRIGMILTDVLRHLSENTTMQDDLRTALSQLNNRDVNCTSISHIAAEQEFVNSFYPGFRDPVQSPLIGLPCKLLAGVVREALRLQVNIPSSRFTLGEKRVRVAGLSSHVVIPRHSTTFICPEAILRNSDVFDHPNTFDPSRWDSPSNYMVQSMCTLSLNDPHEIIQDCAALVETFVSVVIPAYSFHVPENAGILEASGNPNQKSTDIIVRSTISPHTLSARISRRQPPPILLDHRSNRRPFNRSDFSCLSLF